MLKKVCLFIYLGFTSGLPRDKNFPAGSVAPVHGCIIENDKVGLIETRREGNYQRVDPRCNIYCSSVSSRTE